MYCYTWGTIGDNCIIRFVCGVSKNIPDNSIVVGNSFKIIANSKDWAQKNIWKINLN